MILLIIIALILIGLGSILVTHFYKRGKNKSENNKVDNKEKLVFYLDKLTYWLLYVAVLSLGGLIFGSYILTRNAKWEWADLSNKGDLGDAIGGLTSPFIGFAGVIVTGLAFYMQYRANRLQVEIFKDQNKQVKTQFQKQLKKQNKEDRISQFESQFYERLRLLKEEISELRLMNFEKNEFQGRYVFYELEKELRFIYLVVRDILPKDVKLKQCFELSYDIFYKGRKSFFKSSITNDYEFLKDKALLNKLKSTFESMYFYFQEEMNGIEIENKKDAFTLKDHVLFDFKSSPKGFEKFPDVRNSDDSKMFESMDIGNNLINVYDKINLSEKYSLTSNFEPKKTGEKYYKKFKDKFDTTMKHLPFHGMYTKLSIVFRQMHGLVKFVVNNDMLTYEDKRSYLRVLRGILGNYEQLHLFYNWYGGIGPQWENDENCYFSDYRMIHNLPIGLLIEDIPIEDLFKDDFMYERDKKDMDSLFEINEVFSIKED
ncbi:putative phage abortive infection protein [Myroides guanonis]|uniref:Phage abortive infection protein n=1 Tax=Myroides guanonis TaxID=1150112 RepID=A0A1I3LMP3_9FLAO|nr:putative phage abortive infection protein [Myroides guanonis]SFI85746.1 Putative phage abortive infection protein [Myroides guanonis]